MPERERQPHHCPSARRLRQHPRRLVANRVVPCRYREAGPRSLVLLATEAQNRAIVLSMNELSTILSAATAAIDERFMKLPIYHGSPVYRERVYCYELYHQLRSRWPDPCD